jgi:hypothetical protein
MRILKITAVVLAVLVAAVLLLGYGAGQGWWGVEQSAGTVHATPRPPEMVAARIAAEHAAAPSADAKQILFGDLHVHTTYSTDAFMFALPINGGTGLHPVSDACDFARFCSALDFWAITDHAEAGTPTRWQRTKDAIRQCNKTAGGGSIPDLISFIGFEWTQVGRIPSEHYGHKNVIFESLDDTKIAARQIAAAGVTTQTLRTQARGLPPGIVLEDPDNRQIYFDFNHFIKAIQNVPECAAGVSSDKLPANCFESAATPAELVAKLDEQHLDPLIIPHGSSWGFYTPAGTTWDKALDPKEHPERMRLIEIYSGHGNSEEFRAWKDVIAAPDGKSAICPPATADYTPSCVRAGEIIAERCAKAGLPVAECAKRAATARSNYANMGIAGHLSVPGATPEDWLDAGQCRDCFLPPFNDRPGTSVQYGLAVSHFRTGPNGAPDMDGVPDRFRWGFIGSSDNHQARPGTGYKQYDRRANTEGGGPPTEKFRALLAGKPVEPAPQSKLIPREDLMKMSGFQLTEFERQTSFFLTGGLAAVHADARTREGVWNALQRREVYATSGQRILLWFDYVAPDGKRSPMGSSVTIAANPVFEVRAVGSFKQKPGCPDFDKEGMDQARLKTLCSGECFNPSDERNLITRIEVVRIRPQISPDESIASRIEDKFIVHNCTPDANGCTFRFSDPSYAGAHRDSIYYVRAIQEARPTINGANLRCTRDAKGQCVKVNICYGDYRSGKSDCLAPAEPRAWSSPIYLDVPRAVVKG